MLRWIDVLTYARYSNPEPPRRVNLTDQEWAAQLTPAQFRVLRQQHTEPPYRNAYCRSYEPGVYVCAGCNSPLFDSTTKYHAISGWPSFTQPLTRSAISYFFDDSHHMQRVEVRCNVCGGHLGHVFPDGPAPGGLRYCINSESIRQLPPPTDAR
ncbi:peptide-methionine (R)-S-oxide reductase MsrB [Hymenobacter sp. BT186]|uniref:peptide-methionine (R)-S-oxide reductase n=1 Tax=Hymenobacter telluris TaxID=2816474 RepID=A0A939JCT3_9BACT|nr:peptide-methionine (R)-S-oxide reductase MsrB [Hymenobacter telluris]MBO0358183.1 peptide-methionine (R)-S-oxide reductase MsrB [Hymenobacter telluris]MBW3374210.1 peptide-methionine (R)-S-oxide reductase MsrB [Hymenobacter norwichensis]